MSSNRNTTWKRVVAILLSLTISSSALAGCGGSNIESATSTISNTTETQESSAESSEQYSTETQDKVDEPIDEEKNAFATGWEFAREYLSNSKTLVSDPDYEDEYKSFVEIEKDESAKAAYQDDWLIEDSLDDDTNESLDVSMRYYANPEKEEIEQAQSIIREYEDYYLSASNPKSFTEYIEKNGYKGDYSELLPSKDGLEVIIGSDDIEDAVNFVKGDKKLLFGVSKEAKEVLKKLKERVEGKAESEEISNEELLAISEMVSTGKITIEEFNVPVSKVVTPKYVFKQAITHVDKETIVRFVLQVAPDIIAIIREVAKSEVEDSDDLEKLLTKNDTFRNKLKGIICAVIEEAVRTGRLGEKFKNLTDEQIAELADIALKVIIATMSLFHKKIKLSQYVVTIFKDVVPLVLSIKGVSTDDNMQTISPVYLMGNLVAGMLYSGSADIESKEILDFNMVDANGIGVIVPDGLDCDGKVIEGYFDGLDIAPVMSSGKEIMVNVTGDSSLRVDLAA